MLQKEDSRKLGWALIILSFAILIGSLANNFGSITGAVTFSDSLTATSPDDALLVIGEQITFTISGGTGSYTFPLDAPGGCVSQSSSTSNTVTLQADSINSGCTYQVTDSIISYVDIILDVRTSSRTASTQNLVTSPDVSTTINYYTPETGSDNNELT